MMPPPVPARQPAEGDLADIIRAASLAADLESVQLPGERPRTPSERTRHAAETVIMYCIENGLLAVTPQARDRLRGWLPVQRAGPVPPFRAGS